MSKRQEQFPIKKEIVEQFIKVNEKVWAKPIGSSGRNVFINLSMVRMQSAWLIPKLLFARGICEQTGDGMIVLTWSENPLLTRFFESFGAKHVTLDSLISQSIGGNIKSGFKVLSYAIFNGSPEGLKAMNSLGLDEGLAIYEDILRTSSLSTIRSGRNKTVLKKTLHLYMVLYALDSYLKKVKPSVLINDDMAYHENAVIRLFMSHGADVYSVNSEKSNRVKKKENGRITRNVDLWSEKYREEFSSLDDSAVEKATDLLSKRFKGLNGRDIDRAAFAGKRVLSREDMCAEYGIDPSKKTVVIMAHTFTDAVFNYGTYEFRDYYDWTEKTLKIAAENPSVNWILKPHPTRNAYNESSDSIEDMFAREKKDHMFFMNDDVSAESIKNVADVLVTIGGNAGAEFSCFGIPAIIVGKPYYADYGYTYEPSSYNEYKELLMKVKDISCLNEEQIKTAKKVFYLAGRPIEEKNGVFNDEFGLLLNGRYKDMFEKLKTQYFMGNDGTSEYNSEILDFVTKYEEEKDIRNTDYYLRGKRCK